MKAFDKAVFEAAFGAALITLAGSEKVTKAELQVLSRTVLEAWHITGDVMYVNKLIGILTPVNKKVAIEYFTTFGGFSFDDVLGAFTKKSKKRYDDAYVKSMAFLEDPMNNIWSWADRNIVITSKEFTLDAVTDGIKGYLKKAGKSGFSQADVMRAIIKGGIATESIITVMEEMGYEEVVTEETVITPMEMVGEAPM